MQLEYWTSAMEKQVGARVQVLLESPLLLKAHQEFGGRPFRRSSVFHGLGQFLKEQKIRGHRCFEIGTWNGLTAAVLSQFFDEVVTVDIAHNELKHRLLATLGIQNVTCIDIKDNEDKPGLVQGLDFDFAYLDGDHAHDTETDFALVKHSGRVLFHECWPFQEKVWETVHRLPHEQVVFGGAGLALWRKGEE